MARRIYAIVWDGGEHSFPLVFHDREPNGESEFALEKHEVEGGFDTIEMKRKADGALMVRFQVHPHLIRGQPEFAWWPDDESPGSAGGA